MDRHYRAWLRICGTSAAAVLSVALLVQSGVADVREAAGAGANLGLHLQQTAQLPRYTASGRHQCSTDKDAKKSCIVTGQFSSCNEASIGLKTRDCCPTSAAGGTSHGFTMSYCIPDMSGR